MSEKISRNRKILLKVGKAIQFWRKLDGHNQDSFSKVLGTARSYVSRLEAGHSGVSFARLLRIADKLEISVFALTVGVPEKEEVRALLDLYDEPKYKVTKEELEILFSARIKGKILTYDYYLNLLSIIRSGVFTKES